MDDVLDDCAGFGQGDGVGWVGVVFKHGGGAQRVFRFEIWWREERRALVVHELVGDVEFFQQPGDAFSLANLEVVDCEVGCCHFGVMVFMVGWEGSVDGG